jgi:hypothetical protein
VISARWERKGYAATNPALVREARRLARKSPKTGKARSLREIADELARLGHVTATGRPFSAAQVLRLIGGVKRRGAAVDDGKGGSAIPVSN